MRLYAVTMQGPARKKKKKKENKELYDMQPYAAWLYYIQERTEGESPRVREGERERRRRGCGVWEGGDPLGAVGATEGNVPLGRC